MGEGVEFVGEVAEGGTPGLVFGGDAGSVGGADGGGTVGAVVGGGRHETGQQVTTSVMISVPSSVVKTTSGLLELSGIMPVTSVRVRRPTMRPMEA